MEMLGDIGGRVPGFSCRLQVGANIVVEHRSVGAAGLADIQHRGQHFVFDLDQPRRFLGNVHRIGRHRRNGVAGVEHLVIGEHVLVEVVPVNNPFTQIPGAVIGRRHIGVGAHSVHPRDLGGLGGVDRNDPRVRVRAPEHVALQQPGELDVSPVASPAGHLVGAIVSDRSGADHVVIGQSALFDQSLVAGRPPGKRLNAELAVFDGRHQLVTPSAACWTARTILS